MAERKCRYCNSRVRLIPMTGRARGPVWVHVDRGAGARCQRWRRRQLDEADSAQPDLPGLFPQELW